MGEAGTGKTLLLRQLLGAPPPGIWPVVLLQPRIEFDALVEFIARQLGAASSAGLAGLRTALAAEADAGRNVVLLVEEAQALPPDTLAALPELTLPLTGAGGSAMQVLLAGPPTLLAALEAAELRDRVAVLACLEPWAASDVAVYVHGQLARAGAAWRLFTPAAVARLAQVTEGVPRRVNTIADASLAVASSVGADSVTEEHVNAAWESYSQLDATHTPTAEPEEPRFVRRGAPPIRERLLPPPNRTMVPRRTRRTRARLLPAGALAVVLVLGIVVTRPPSWWHRGAGTTPEPRRVASPRQPSREPLPTAGEALDAVDALRRAYEARDAAAVENLLALDATQGGAARLAAVAPDLRALDRLEDVAYLQPAAQLEPRGATMEVRTSFEIRYRNREGRTGELRGTAVWQVARRDGAPRIVGLARALAPGSVLPDELALAKP